MEVGSAPSDPLAQRLYDLRGQTIRRSASRLLAVSKGHPAAVHASGVAVALGQRRFRGEPPAGGPRRNRRELSRPGAPATGISSAGCQANKVRPVIARHFGTSFIPWIQPAAGWSVCQRIAAEEQLTPGLKCFSR